MNIASAWQLPPWQLALSPLMVWKPFYRPLAGWLFVPILSLFGLNPLPFHAVMLVFVLANVFLARRLAKLLGACERASWIVALILCYHAGVKEVYYNTSFIYDVLCCFLYLATLIYYVRIRRAGTVLTWRQTITFLGLYLLALSAKEMAATLPIVILLYECFFHKPPPWRPGDLAVWIRGPGRCVLVGIGVNLVYLWGRVFGAGGLALSPGYGLALSMAQVWDFQSRTFGDVFEAWPGPSRAGVIAIWFLMFYLAWRRPSPVLRFACLFLLLTPLPIEFLTHRSGSQLYIPIIGWSLFVSVVLVGLADGAAEFLSGMPVGRHLRRTYVSATLIAIAVIFWVRQNVHYKWEFVDPITLNIAPQTWKAIQQLREIGPRVPSNSTVVFLDDPFPTFDMAFIAELWFRDRTVSVRLRRHTPLSPSEIQSAACIFDYRDGNLVRVR